MIPPWVGKYLVVCDDARESTLNLARRRQRVDVTGCNTIVNVSFDTVIILEDNGEQRRRLSANKDSERGEIKCQE